MTLRERNYLKRAALRQIRETAWRHLYNYGDDRDFLNTTSLTREAFEKLLIEFRKFDPYNVNRSKGGRLPTLPYSHDRLGLILIFYTDSMTNKSLCLLFGIVPSSLSRFLRKAEDALLLTLKSMPHAEFRWPSLENQLQWGLKVQALYPEIEGRWGFIDGKNYKVQKPSQADLQNAMYNGWLHATLVTGCLCFDVSGCICWGKHNFVGSWNDGEMSRAFQEKLCRDEFCLKGHGVVSDSAFPVSGKCFGRIMTPIKDGDIEKAHPLARPALLHRSRKLTSLRQACEWGMGAVEKVYRRLLLPLPFNQVTRGTRLACIHRLYNYRVRTTGISQIRNTFL